MCLGRLESFIRVTGWFACLVAVTLSLALPSVADRAVLQWSPWVAGLVFLGIPHGAIDHLVGASLLGSNRAWRMGGFFAGYLTVMVLVGMLWLASPLASLVVFLSVAALHFGAADLAWSRETGLLARKRSVAYAGCLLASRATLPVLLPALAHPDVFAGVANGLIRMMDVGRSSWNPPGAWLVAGWSLVLIPSVVQVTWSAWWSRRGGPDARDAAIEGLETLGLIGLFTFVQPVLAVGVYFNAWHAARHVARMVRVVELDAPASASGTVWASLVRFQRAAMPLTAGSLLILALLGLAIGSRAIDPAELGRLVIVLLSMLTLPHAIVVAWFDIRDGIWSIRSGTGKFTCPQLDLSGRP